MPLLDHFHAPLHGSRRWEGFHHAWAVTLADLLNNSVLPSDYHAEPEISIGPTLEVDVATVKLRPDEKRPGQVATMPWSPPRPKMAMKVDFRGLDIIEVRVYEDIGGLELRAAVELVSPRNKDRPSSRRTFAAKCAGYLKHGIGVVIVDIVTARSANLHRELVDTLGTKSRRVEWQSATGLYAVAYRAVTLRRSPRVEIWPETLTVGKVLPTMPLWLALDLCVPLQLEQGYLDACRSLRISA
jgi:hypothetical protein